MANTPAVSQSRRKMRKALFTADANTIRVMMSSRLSKELRAAYGFKTFPIHSGDIVTVTTGKFKGKEGKVLILFLEKTEKLLLKAATTPKHQVDLFYIL
jgi:ribosomal protein uL24